LRYILLNKPYNTLCTFSDPEGRETLKAYIDVPDVYSAGRLDYDSEGLLLLTDDGGLSHRLTDPSHHLPKTYLAQVEGVPTPEALARLEKGVTIKDYQTRPCQAQVAEDPGLWPRRKAITPHAQTSWIRLVLEEGKKRQIRHMTAAVGLPTLRLVRVAIGPLVLGNLAPGEWRDLTPSELATLKVLTHSPRSSSRAQKSGPFRR
jgi:23S rRNA pseudouridine2457 synthase